LNVDLCLTLYLSFATRKIYTNVFATLRHPTERRLVYKTDGLKN
jgi:hypothetical protein